jgi:hypothetical protein
MVDLDHDLNHLIHNQDYILQEYNQMINFQVDMLELNFE